jgi:hypothetical protein
MSYENYAFILGPVSMITNNIENVAANIIQIHYLLNMAATFNMHW